VQLPGVNTGGGVNDSAYFVLRAEKDDETDCYEAMYKEIILPWIFAKRDEAEEDQQKAYASGCKMPGQNDDGEEVELSPPAEVPQEAMRSNLAWMSVDGQTEPLAALARLLPYIFSRGGRIIKFSFGNSPAMNACDAEKGFMIFKTFVKGASFQSLEAAGGSAAESEPLYMPECKRLLKTKVKIPGPKVPMILKLLQQLPRIATASFRPIGIMKAFQFVAMSPQDERQALSHCLSWDAMDKEEQQRMIDLVPVLSREAVAVQCYVPEALMDAHNVPMAIDPPEDTLRTNEFIIQALAKARRRKPSLTGPMAKMRSFIICPLFLSKRLQAIASEKLVAEKAREETAALKAQKVLTKEQKKAAVEERKLERADEAKKKKKVAKKKKKKKKKMAEKLLREEAKAAKQAVAAETKAAKTAKQGAAAAAKAAKQEAAAAAKAAKQPVAAKKGRKRPASDLDVEDFSSSRRSSKRRG
jgi:chemotaxis protein histidine kinase CheA